MRCFPTSSSGGPHLPPRTEPARLRCVVPARLPRRPSMRFLFIGSSVSSSLPSHGRLPFRSWLRVVVFSCFHVWFFYRGLAPHLQRTHAGHTQGERGNPTAIGSRITIHFEQGTRLTSEIHAGGGYLSQSTSDLSFSLSNANDLKDKIEKIEIRWPDGRTERFPATAADLMLTLRRGEGKTGP